MGPRVTLPPAPAFEVRLAVPDIAQAHQPDEWVAQAELDACDAFIRRLADRLAA